MSLSHPRRLWHPQHLCHRWHLWIVALCLSGATLHAQVLDRILAVVDGAPIMQSDVTAAIRLGLSPTARATDPVAATVDFLVERRLMLGEVERYAPPDPADADIDRHVDDIKRRSGGQFSTLLAQLGLTEDQLRREVRDDLRIDAYLQQRFGAVQPSEEEMLQYYREHPDAFTQNGVLRSFEDVRESVRVMVVAERRGAMIRDWLSGLRRRANINILPKDQTLIPHRPTPHR